MKFFAFLSALIALTLFASPSFADNPWEGTFTKASQENGVWVASVTIRATGVKQTKYFEECRRASGGWQCRNQVDGGGVQSSGADEVQIQTHNGNTTLYAVFHPRWYVRYVPQGRGNIWNLDSEPQMRAACRSAGNNCIVVEAPLHDWEAAVRIAKQQTRWPL